MFNTEISEDNAKERVNCEMYIFPSNEISINPKFVRLPAIHETTQLCQHKNCFECEGSCCVKQAQVDEVIALHAIFGDDFHSEDALAQVCAHMFSISH